MFRLATRRARAPLRTASFPARHLGAFGAMIGRLANPHAAAIGFVHAVAPARALVRETVRAIRRHDDAIVGRVPTELDELEDRDLETGMVVGFATAIQATSRLMMAEA